MTPDAHTPTGNGHEIMVTAETLPSGTSIPILGTLIDLTYIPETEHPPPTTHTYQHDRRTGTTPYRIDGPPRTQEGENIACNGLAIAMKANEPEDTSTGSAIFKHDYIITTKTLRKGDKIRVYYGSSIDLNWRPCAKQTITPPLKNIP